jgi:heme oxygenase
MPAEPTLESPSSFSERIRAATWDAHAGAEHAPFMQDLMAGRSSRLDYAQLVAQHHAIYSVLEAAVDASTDPTIAPLLAPELRRLPELEADLEYLVGPAWAEKLAVTPSTEAYCDQMRRVCFDWSGGLVAHHYVRYLGDLSGGLVIGRVVARVYDLPDGEGTRFYRFDGIDNPKDTKDEYRRVLDELPWSEDEQDRVIDEVLEAYRHNTEVLLDLTPDLPEVRHPVVDRAVAN